MIRERNTTRRALTERIDMRVDRETMEKLARIAERNERSIGAVVRLALRDWLARQEED